MVDLALIRSSLAAFRARWRIPLLLIALALFTCGIAWSTQATGLSWDDLHYSALLLLICVMTPLNILYSVANLLLMARATRAPMSFMQGLSVSAWAQLAELLPIPGAAMIRTSALAAHGAKLGNSVEIVLACALSWIAIGASAASFAMAGLWPLAWVSAAIFLICAAGLTGWIATRYGLAIAATMAGLRLFGLGLFALRLMIAFAALGVSISVVDGLVFGFAAIVGSASSLVPAGLGVTEGLSALLAAPLGITAGSAFLAAAVARITSLMVNGLIAVVLTGRKGVSGDSVDLAEQEA